MNRLISALRVIGEEVETPEVVRVCRDPGDDIFIAVAVAASTDYLVPRDDDLKDDGEVRAFLWGTRVRLVSVRQFVAILEVLERQEGEPGGSPSR